MRTINSDNESKALIEALNTIPASDLNYHDWIKIGIACYSSSLDFSVWDSWSSKDSRYNSKACADAWRTFTGRNYSKVGAGSIFWIAKQYGYKMPENIRRRTWQEEFDNYAAKTYGTGAHLVNEYRYTDANGHYQYSKIRIEGGNISTKLFVFFRVDDTNGTFSKVEEPAKYLYNLPKLIKGIKKGFPVFIVEGEKDCVTLENLENFPCTVTTAGSATAWQKEFAQIFRGCTVNILRDNDKDGERMAAQISADLKHYAHSVKVVNLSRMEKGDVTDYIQKECGTAETLKGALANVSSTYAPWISFDGKKVKLIPGILAKCIQENEHYFITRLPEDDKDSFYLYRGGVYERCNRNSIKAMIGEYIPDSLKTDGVLNNIYALLMASEEKVRPYEFMYSEYGYINFKNGLLKVATDEFIAHTPDIITTYQFDFDYKPGYEVMPYFNIYFSDFCRSASGEIDVNKIKLLQEVGGLILSADKVSKTKKVPVLYSAEGNSGKSVFISLLENFLGMERITTANLRDLTPDNRFVFGKLQSTRLITCGDESNTTVNDSSILKRLSGGDSIKIESKGRQGFSAKYDGGIIIACNGLPVFADDKGNQLFERLLIIPCEHHIEVAERDPNILERIINEKPAIFNFFYLGYKRLIKNGYKYTECGTMAEVMEEYRLNADALYRFVTEKCDRTNDAKDRISRAGFDKAFTDWCMSEGLDIIPKNSIKIRMESIGIRTDWCKCDGTAQNSYLGLVWKH